MARRLEPGRLVLATHNKGKVKEVAALLAGYGLDLVSAGDLGLPTPPDGLQAGVPPETVGERVVPATPPEQPRKRRPKKKRHRKKRRHRHHKRTRHRA